ncbi:sugar ABC transporter permease [Paenibacillus oralis]|uniref:Sugar ABC transporter permease n=2 Tax=Paenibacillus oralis TaxID=2490856 RepID=A0A3P3UCR2_9BACL|nr:sugar ABC transporter permease [Paenibacillus oralis]
MRTAFANNIGRRLARFRKSDGASAIWLLAPSLAGFCLFFILPFGVAFYYSMVDTPVGGSFVGLHNYAMLLDNASFRRALWNSLRFTALCVPLNMMLALALATWLHGGAYGRRWFRIAFVTPLVIPVASVVFVWQMFFDLNGVLNGWLQSWGWTPTDWMGSSSALGVTVVVYLWKNVGYNMLLFLAGLQNIPVDYYEAARIDGAGRWRQWRSITLVYLMPTSFFVLVMSIVNSFKVFRETYILAGAYPDPSMYTLQHFMNNMFQQLDYQKMTAAAFLLAAGISLLVLILFIAEDRFNRSL